MAKKFLYIPIAIGALSLWGMILSVGKDKSVTTVKAPVSNTQEERPTRKLTLTLGQSAHSVKMHPALIDQIDEEAFINLISAYMDQPFDFTYQQDGLIFNVTLTHTLTLVARQKELAAIDVELSPLFEDDFEKAFQLLMDWDAFFNGAGLVKLNKSYYVPLGQLKAKFDAVHNENLELTRVDGVRVALNSVSEWTDLREVFLIFIQRKQLISQSTKFP